eukprot:GHVL01038192.1.p1 GENE.GHVL01038192.1~~GHVL01038192.1.p1  ORF type:complete len:368 (+),score=61.76 GHVL01038192.1:75-1178(+)
MAAVLPPPTASKHHSEQITANEHTRDCRHNNIIAAKAVADVVRTSLGPKGMDKMIQAPKGSVIITNDGATILQEIVVKHPAAKMLVDLSKSQDVEAGDGTTSVVVIAGALLGASETLLNKGIHPQLITKAFLMCAEKSEEILENMSLKIKLEDRESLLQAAMTSLQSKVVASSAGLLAPLAVDAVLKVVDITKATNVDLTDIRISKKLGATIDESELVEGLVFVENKIARNAFCPSRVSNAKIGLIQFCMSPPKTDMENQVAIKDYASIDRLLREERLIIAKMVKHIAATGCNVLLIQKSILRDATTELSLDFLAKANILVMKDIERDDIEFISRTIGCEPAATLDTFTAEKLGFAEYIYINIYIYI